MIEPQPQPDPQAPPDPRARPDLQAGAEPEPAAPDPARAGDALDASEDVFDLDRARDTLGVAGLTREDRAHCERTAGTARELAARFGVDEEKAFYAGLVHDIARALADEDLLAMARRFEVPVSEVDRARPYLLHAELGAHVAAELLGISDPEVLTAISSHTFGRVGMSDLEKVIYLADTIEPMRHFDGVDELREIAVRDLDAAVLAAYRRVICHLTERGRPLHPRTVDVWNWLCRMDVTA